MPAAGTSPHPGAWPGAGRWPGWENPPTAELHVHVEGTLEPAAVVAMAARNGVSIPVTDPYELLARYCFSDLQSFLDLHYANLSVLRTGRDFFELATGYLDRARAANVRRAEVFFDPQTHVWNGVALEAVMEVLTAAIRDSERTHGISADLIMCFLRDRAAESDLCCYLSWRGERDLGPLAARRPHLELCIPWMREIRRSALHGGTPFFRRGRVLPDLRHRPRPGDSPAEHVRRPLVA